MVESVGNQTFDTASGPSGWKDSGHYKISRVSCESKITMIVLCDKEASSTSVVFIVQSFGYEKYPHLFCLREIKMTEKGNKKIASWI